MLVLSRKPGERIHIGSDIIVTIVDVSGKLVRIGVEAPQSVNILRDEVKVQIENANKLAAVKSKYLNRLREYGIAISTKRKIHP